MGIRHFKKNIAENSFMFPLDMYTNLPGSIVITSVILNGSADNPDLLQIRKRWKYFTRHGLGFSLSDPDYLSKVLKSFDREPFPLEFAAFVQSDFNALVCPYVDGHVLPLREDGHLTRTLLKGKVYKLTEKGGLKNGNDECNMGQAEADIQ